MADENIDTPEVKVPAPEVLREAESQGWVPKEKFRGNETDWVDAETFVKRGREILPILRKNNENLVRDLNQTREELKQFREAADEFKKFQKESYERKVADYERTIQELRASRAQAISDGDGVKVDALDEQLDNAKDELREAKEAAKQAAKAPPEPTPAQAQNLDPALQAWLGTNDWFGKDRRMTTITNAIGENLRVERPDLKGQAFLDALDEILSEEFPDRFAPTGKKSGRGSVVESGAGRQGRPRGNAHSYDNLPDDAKAACDKFVKQKLMTREEYVASYSWD